MDTKETQPIASDIKIFVPAKNFAKSLAFYKALGWQVNFVTEDNSLAELELANTRFYLQNYYQRGWANNFMMHISVTDAAAWYAHAERVIASGVYKPARTKVPVEEPYGALVTYVWDPSGVLLHFAQTLNKDNQ